MDLQLSGWTVESVGGDAPHRLVLTNGILRAAISVDPGTLAPAAVGALLMGKEVLSAFGSDETGELVIAFAGGAVLREQAEGDVEAWELQRSDGFAVFCMPGGELAVFPATGSGPVWLRSPDT